MGFWILNRNQEFQTLITKDEREKEKKLAN